MMYVKLSIGWRIITVVSVLDPQNMDFETMILNFGSLTVIKAAYFFVQQYFKIQSTSFITAFITTAKLLVMSF